MAHFAKLQFAVSAVARVQGGCDEDGGWRPLEGSSPHQGYTIPQSGPTTGRGNMLQNETDVPKRDGQVLDNVVMLYLNEKVKKQHTKLFFISVITTYVVRICSKLTYGSFIALSALLLQSSLLCLRKEY